jgi:hypothetical protein
MRFSSTDSKGKENEMNILPKGEEIRKAVKWVSEIRREEPDKNLMKIIDEASLKFNLSPMEAEYLMRLCREEKGK